MSGYDQHPDYGSPPAGRHELAKWVVAWIAVCGAIVWFVA